MWCLVVLLLGWARRGKVHTTSVGPVKGTVSQGELIYVFGVLPYDVSLEGGVCLLESGSTYMYTMLYYKVVDCLCDMKES